jgi:CHAT domain-containing protein
MRDRSEAWWWSLTQGRRGALACAVGLGLLMPGASEAQGRRDDEGDWNYCLKPFDASANAPNLLRLAGIFWMPEAPATFAADQQQVLDRMREMMASALQGVPGLPPGLVPPSIQIQRPASPPPSARAGASPSPGPSETVALNRDAIAHVLAGRYAQAEPLLTRCIAAAERGADLQAGAACSGNLGVVQALQGRTDQARQAFELSRQRYAAWADALKRPPAPVTDPTRAVLANARREIDPRVAAVGQVRAWLNLGSLDANAGQMQRADEAFQAALAQPAPPPEPPGCRAAAAQDLVRLYRRLGRAAPADALLARHAVRQPGGLAVSPYMEIYLEPGAVALGGAGGSGVAVAAAPPPDVDSQTAMLDEALGRRTETALQRTLAEARQEAQAGQRPAAIRSLAVLALRAAAAARSDLAALAHADLMRLLATDGQPAAAIYHGKLAVNLLQSGRAGLAGEADPRAAQRAYLRARAPVYTALAQLLMDAQRLPEAEQVLRLLKEDEGRLYATTADTAAHATLVLRDDEAAAQARLAQAAQRLQQADVARSQALAASAFSVNGYSPFNRIDLTQLEQGRLGLTEPSALQELTTTLEDAYREVAAQARQQPLAGVVVGRMVDAQLASQLTMLEHLAEDAPAFVTVRPTPGQLASLSKAIERLRALRAAHPVPQAPTDPQASAALEAGARLGALFSGKGAASVTGTPEVLWRTDRAMHAIEDAHVRDDTDLPRQLAAARGTLPAADDDTATLLRQRAPTAALLHILPGDDRVDLLLTTAQGRRAWRVPLPQATLAAQTEALLAVLRHANNDPLPPARALYDSLLAPVAPALAQAGVTQLVLSVSGRLRFVPFAALHDGRQWLVERYALALQPGGRLADALQPSARGWRVAAFGASQGGQGLKALASVPLELASVVRQAPVAGAEASAGALPGQAWLDRAFTADALRAALDGRHQVLHIASHFAFSGGDAQRSFLLLGDGQALSLQALAGPAFRFDRTELVTLSACETALSAADGYGQEVDGLAALLMAQGARAVMASLWLVNDESTAQLMGALYRAHEGSAGVTSRAEALRQAQLALISGRIRPVALRPTAAPAAPVAAVAAGAKAGGTSTRGLGRDGVDDAAAPASRLGWAHPYHWAPFVLMGSWL